MLHYQGYSETTRQTVIIMRLTINPACQLLLRYLFILAATLHFGNDNLDQIMSFQW